MEMFRYIREYLKNNGFTNHVPINLFSKLDEPISTGINFTIGNNQKNSCITLGLGAGAASFVHDHNFKSVCSVKDYIEIAEKGKHPIAAGNIVSESVSESRVMVYFPNFMCLPKSEIPNDKIYAEKLLYLINEGFIIAPPINS